MNNRSVAPAVPPETTAALKPETIKRNPMFVYLVVLTICSTVGLQTWSTLFNNYAVDIAGLNGAQVGMIQSIREIPGFLALLAVYVMMVVREHRLSALSILILGAGLAATGAHAVVVKAGFVDTPMTAAVAPAEEPRHAHRPDKRHEAQHGARGHHAARADRHRVVGKCLRLAVGSAVVTADGQGVLLGQGDAGAGATDRGGAAQLPGVRRRRLHGTALSAQPAS